MNKQFWPLLLALASPVALSQQPLTVSTGNAPFIFDREESQFAPLTIEETTPGAFRDGYITLYGRLNPEQEIRFTPATTVTGSVAGYRIERSISGDYALIIEVDADDGAIDRITINPVAWLDYDTEFYVYRNVSIGLRLEDGHPPLQDGQGPGEVAGLGAAAGNYDLGIFGGSGEVSIGGTSSVTLGVGETRTLSINGGEPTHPGDLMVESFDPMVVSVDSHTLSEVEITGRSPGQALVQSWDPAGNSGYLHVTVSAGGPSGSEEPPASDAQAGESAMRSLAPVAVGGGGTSARLLAGAEQSDGQVTVVGEIQPESGHLNRPTELFVAARFTNAAGASAWFQKDSDGRFLRWDRRLDSLQPARRVASLAEREALAVYEGPLPAGEYQLYLGYMVEGGSFIYSRDPLILEVSP